jgi:hypothetical protein
MRGDSIPFQVFLYDYHALKDNALQNGDIEVKNNQVHNVPGRNPLEARTVVMALPCSKSPTHNEQLQQVFAPLDKSLATTGYLVNQQFSFVEPN